MIAELKQHISLVSDNPLDAVIAGQNTKAYIIAQFAFADGIDATIEQYSLSKAAIYAAMSFYEDNREAIKQALEAEHQGLIELGMVSSKDVIAKINKRRKEADKPTLG